MSPISVIITVLAYIAVLFLVAWWSGRKADNASFFTGARKTPWYIAAFAMVGAAISGVTFISVPGSVAADGFSYMQMVLGFFVGNLIIAFVLIPLFYKMNVVSLYEYLDTRFGVLSHKTGAWFFFISKMLGAALRAYVVCAVLQLLVFDQYNLPFVLNAAIMMLLVWLYTRQGGVKSIVWTDTLKTFCLIGSVVLCIVFVMRDLGLSVGEMTAQVAGHDYSKMFFFDNVSDSRYFWKKFVAGIFMVIAMTGLDQDMMQRTLSCKDYKDSQKNLIVSILMQLVVIFLFLVLGVLLFMFLSRENVAAGAEGLFPMFNEAGQAVINKSDQVFSFVAVNGGFPAIVGILFVLGLISSTYSAAGSAMTALTTSFTVDILEGQKRYDDQKLTKVRQTVHVAMAVIMGVAILVFDKWGNDSVINLVYSVASYTYGPILGMFAFGIMCKKQVNDKFMPVVAIIAPVLSFVIQKYAPVWFNGYQIGFELLIINAAITMIGMALLIRRDKK